MLKPPSPKSLSQAMVLDPSMALKSRGFSQGGRIQRGAGAGAGEDDGSLWTETPAEREQRIREEEMGIRGRKVLGEEKKVKPEDLERQRKEREAYNRLLEVDGKKGLAAGAADNGTDDELDEQDYDALQLPHDDETAMDLDDEFATDLPDADEMAALDEMDV